MSELKPCPFCGNYPILRQDASEWKVECIGEGCECLPSTWFYDTKEDAIKAWNRRTAEAEPVRYGRWIVDDEFIDCSVCRSEKWSKVPYESLVRGFKYCPKCGAKMVDEDPSHPFADSVMMGD